MKSLFEGHVRGGVRRYAGVAIIVLGMFWFGHKAGWIPAHESGHAYIWPALTIGIGLILYFRPHHKCENTGDQN